MPVIKYKLHTLFALYGICVWRKPYILHGTYPIQPVEGTQIMSVQTGRYCSDCMCCGALCDGVMW